jgi:hypothetical protein
MSLGMVHWWTLMAVLALTGLFFALGRLISPGEYPVRLFYRLFFVMYFVFSGIGGAYLDDSAVYLLYYGSYGLAYSLVFVGVTHLLATRWRWLRPTGGLVFLSHGWAWRGAMAAYLLLQLAAMIYPENKLLNLLHPPPLNLANVWNDGILGEMPVGEKLLHYPLLLLLPVYYYGIGCLRCGWWLKALLIALPLYLAFCRTGYVGRSELLVSLAVLGIPFWLQYPKVRRWLVAGSLVALPFLLAAAQTFQGMRLGDDGDREGGLGDRILTTVYQQTSFPEHFDEIRRHGPRGQLSEVVQWVVCLPFPSALVHKSAVYLNPEISEIVTGLTAGQDGYYICLTGIVTEAYYLLGPWMVLHACLLAVLSAVMVFVYAGNPQRVHVWALVAFVLSYNLNRGGISSCLTVMINGMLVLNVIMVMTVMNDAVRKKRCR